MNEHEAYVRERWDRRLDWLQITPMRGVINGFSEIYAGRVDDFPNPQSAAWQAAYEFTTAREEEIRQIAGEIAEVQGELNRATEQFYYALHAGGSTGASYWAMKKHRWTRVLARLEAHLATLKRGMKVPIAGASEETKR